MIYSSVYVKSKVYKIKCIYCSLNSWNGHTENIQKALPHLLEGTVRPYHTVHWDLKQTKAAQCPSLEEWRSRCADTI